MPTYDITNCLLLTNFCSNTKLSEQYLSLVHGMGSCLPLGSHLTMFFCPPSFCSNTKLSEQYLSLARDLDVMEAKTAEDVYKMHLVEGRAPTGEQQHHTGTCLVLCKTPTRCTWWRGARLLVRGMFWSCLDWLHDC